MALTKLRDFWDRKTIKLSDAFDVLIDFEGTGINYERMITCCGFTLPKFEFEEETMKYGNMSQIFLTPKYDSCKELTLEFFETTNIEKNPDFNIKGTTDKEKEPYIFNKSVTLSKFLSYMGLTKLSQKYIRNKLKVNSADYNIYKYIPEIKIKILNNKLNKYVYEYRFINLKLSNYNVYNLDYQSDSPVKISVILAFEAFERYNLSEEIKFIENENIPNDNDNTNDENNKNDSGDNNNNDVDPPSGNTGVENDGHQDTAPDNTGDVGNEAPNNKTENTDTPVVEQGQPEDEKTNTPEQLETNGASASGEITDNDTQDPAQTQQDAPANQGQEQNESTDGATQDPSPSQPAPEQSVTEQPSPEQPAPEQPAPEQTNEQPQNVEIQQDELGNSKLENEEGTLYRTKDNKDYYQDKESGKIYDADDGFKESTAKEGLVSETKNGDTQYYTSVVDNGEEVYRGKNVTTEVNTSEHARHTQGNAGQDRTPDNIGANESGSQNNTTVSQTSEGGGQSAHDAAEEARKRKEEEMKAAEEAKKTKAMEEANRGKTRGSSTGGRGASSGGTNSSSPFADDNKNFASNGANR